MNKAHIQSIDDTGMGKYFGVQQSWRPDAPGSGMKQMSCVGWALEVTGATYRATGRGAMWTPIYKSTVAQGAKGTVLCKLLINQGWTGVYWNPNTKGEDGDSEHPFSYRVAVKQKTYYKVPIKDFIINYRAAPPDLSGILKLEKMPYWVGCARGGSHVFCGTRGDVSEYHWDAGPSDRDAIEHKPLKTYEWLSGIIVFPPGLWESGGVPK